MPTIVAGGAVSLTQPILVSVTGGEKPKAPRGVDAPLGTITTRNGLGIAEGRVSRAMISPYYGSGSGETCSSVDAPLGTITPLPRFGLVEGVAAPFLAAHFGERAGQAPRVHALDLPLPRVAREGGWVGKTGAGR